MNEILNAFAQLWWSVAGGMMWQSSSLIVLVLAAAAALRGISPHLRYALLLLALVKLAAPRYLVAPTTLSQTPLAAPRNTLGKIAVLTCGVAASSAGAGGSGGPLSGNTSTPLSLCRCSEHQIARRKFRNNEEMAVSLERSSTVLFGESFR